MDRCKLYLGDALEVLKELPENSVDSVVTDPPYGLRFMNQKWDYDVPSVELWKEVLRVLKPGGHLLSFFGTRTYHRGVVNIEDAGFEIRDMIQWLYGKGFPKGMDISKAIDKEFGKLEEKRVIGISQKQPAGFIRHGRTDEEVFFGTDEHRTPALITKPATPEAEQWQGWNTSLKPANEPIVLARKPISEKNIAQNVLKWGTGGLNIDACRIPVNTPRPLIILKGGVSKYGIYGHGVHNSKHGGYTMQDRFPANVILDGEVAKMLDEQAPNASRFFYCAKAGRDERFAYCRTCDEVIPQKDANKHKGHDMVFHPTVKPLKLVEYLVKLVTPPNGTVLDPFLGTGTTAVAALNCGYRVIGIEINEEYFRIAKHRVSSISTSITDFLK